MSSDQKPWYVRYSIPIAISCITLFWAAVVFASGKKINLTGVEWDFSRTALLGDSFGVVGSVMATMAAAFTFIALDDQRNEVRRLRYREDERDKSDRQREAESTFFRLLDLRNSIVANITHSRNLSSGKEVLHGQQALLYFFNAINEPNASDDEPKRSKYQRHWWIAEGQLGHYLRFTYHIIKFANENFADPVVCYNYVRLLRAQLSNAELKIIALNCAYGDGNPKMTNFVNLYSLMHSLPAESVKELNLHDVFNERAFNSMHWESLRNQ